MGNLVSDQYHLMAEQMKMPSHNKLLLLKVADFDVKAATACILNTDNYPYMFLQLPYCIFRHILFYLDLRYSLLSCLPDAHLCLLSTGLGNLHKSLSKFFAHPSTQRVERERGGKEYTK